MKRFILYTVLAITMLVGCQSKQLQAATRTTYPIFKAWSSTGKPLAGGFLYSYEPGTTTNKATYTDATGLTPNSNPVVMDSLGEGDIFISGDTKLVLKTTAGAVIWTEDAVADEIANRDAAISTAISAIISTGISLDSKYSCDLAAAVAGIGSTVTTLALDCSPVIPEGVTVTVPSTLSLYHNNGAVIAGTAGGVEESLVINGGMTGDMLSQWFDSSVTVTGSPKITEVYPEMFGAVGDGVTDDNSAVDRAVYKQATTSGKVTILPRDYSVTVFKPSNSTVDGGHYKDTVIKLKYGGITPTMCQIGSDTTLKNITIESTETNLSQSRATVETSDNVYLENVMFKGFSDLNAPVDAWGLYFKNSSNIRLKGCTFNNPDAQSDIAFVDNNDNISIDNISGTNLHVNFEPNSSASYNKNITISNSSIDTLNILENGSGGTSNTNISINSCSVNTLEYDGGNVSFNSCEIKSFKIPIAPIYFGEVDFYNTLGLGPELLEDPFIASVALNSGAAATDNNKWYMASGSGFFTDRTAAMEEGGVRFKRFNPSGQSGTIVLTNLNGIPVLTGEYYLVSVTGRWASGTAAKNIAISTPGSFITGTIFRHSNDNKSYFSTESAVIPITANGDMFIRPGLWATSTDIFDIAYISVKKILGKGNSVTTHELSPGSRLFPPVTTIPTLSTPNLNGFITGDLISNKSTGQQYYYNGSGFTGM